MMMQETIGRPMEILLIEDNLSDARLAIESLRDGQIKHRLTLICDGQEAYEFLTREGRFARAPRPDLILLDLELPKKNGRAVGRAQARRDPAEHSGRRVDRLAYP